jgi:molecular chaperone Hsp33
MTTGAQIAWDDTVLPFQLDRSDIRGRVARLDGSLSEILRRHNYPAPVENLLSQAVLLTALIGQTMKLRWKLSLQVRGKGPIRILATDYYAPTEEGGTARLRGYASFDPERLTGDDPFSQIGEGYFAILIDQGQGSTPYSGITPLAGGSLASCAETYFAQSEQLPTRFALALDGPRAGGMMLQHMPPVGMGVAADQGSGEGGLLNHADILSGDAGDNWNRANLLLDTAEADELTSGDLPPPDLLWRLFHEESPRVFPAQAVRFGCSCSEDKVRQSLSIYSSKDIAHMTTPEGTVTADCQFCGAHYVMDPATLGFEAAKNGA